MKKIKEIVKERKFKYISFFWLIISIQFVIGSNLQTKGYLINKTSDVLIILLKTIIFEIIFILLHYTISELFRMLKIKITKTETETEKEETGGKAKYEKYKWLIYFLMIIICWIPTILAFYPCIVGYDGGYQIRWCFFENRFPHHPILITKLYTAFYAIGVIAKSPAFGMLLFSIFQMIVMASIFSYAVKFIEDETQKKWLRNISILFYALYPYNQLFSITTTKDVLFAGLMIIFTIYLYKMVKEKYKISDYIFLIIIGVLMLLSRNNAIYTLKVSLPLMMLILIRNRKNLLKVLVTFLIIIITYQNTNNLLYKLIQKNSAESSDDEGNLRVSTFTQAIGKIARDKKEELTEEEKQKIEFFFVDYQKLGKAYRINIADSTIAKINMKNVNKNKKEFFEFMLEMGKKYPITCIESFLNTTRGYWYIQDTSFSEINIYKCPGAFELYHFGIAGNEYEVIQDSKLPLLKNLYINLLRENEYQKIPVFYIIFQPATYFYITLAFLLYIIYKRETEKLVIAIFLFTFFATCYLAHCSIIRYIYPVIVCAPIMLSITMDNTINTKKEEDNR